MSKKKQRVSRLPADWQVELETRINGRVVTPGTELSIRGQRGRFRFIKRVRTASGHDWLDVVGGPRGHASWRSFAPSSVRRVHRIAHTREGQKAAS